MAASAGPDPARTWVRNADPDDDYLPPVQPPTPAGQVSGHLEDDEGVGPEAVAWAEYLAKPEQRRSRERHWREGQTVEVRDRTGRVRRITATFTREDYQPPIARPAGVRPVQTIPSQAVTSRPRPTIAPESDWPVEADEWGELRPVPPWEFDPDEHEHGVDESLLTSEDLATEERWSHLDEDFDYFDDDDLDDRPLWMKELKEVAGDENGDVHRDCPDVDDAPNVPSTIEVIEAVASCQNPNGCTGPVKAKGRCGPCLEYQRTHHAEERTVRLINRAKRRGSTS